MYFVISKQMAEHGRANGLPSLPDELEWSPSGELTLVSAHRFVDEERMISATVCMGHIKHK